MNAVTRMSAKGQIVIPKDVRDALGWPPGTEIEIVRGAASATLRAKPIDAVDFDWDKWRAELRAISQYEGPVYNDEDFNEAIDAMFREDKDITI